MTLTRALDTSHYQGLLDVPVIARHYGLGWIAFKATEGESYTDADFARNWRSAGTMPGLGRAAYAYAHPELSAAVQAQLLAAVMRSAGLAAGDVAVLDLERGTTQTATNHWAIAFAAAFRKALPGVPLWLYMGLGYAASNTGRGLSAHFDRWWCPHYWSSPSSWPTTFDPRLRGNTTGWASPHIWQWSQALDGRYDADVSPMTFTQLSGEDSAMFDDATLDAIADRVLTKKAIPSKRLDAAGQPTGTLIGLASYIASIDVNTSNGLHVANAIVTIATALQEAGPAEQAAIVAAVTSALQDSVVNVAVTVAGKPPTTEGTPS